MSRLPTWVIATATVAAVIVVAFASARCSGS